MGESKSVASQRFENFTSTNIFSYHNLEMVESSIISVNPSNMLLVFHWSNSVENVVTCLMECISERENLASTNIFCIVLWRWSKLISYL
jgi:hypothetical protein